MTYRKLRKTDLAVLPRPEVRKAAIGEHKAAGMARFFVGGFLKKIVTFFRKPYTYSEICGKIKKIAYQFDRQKERI